jgi:hypothetical protein
MRARVAVVAAVAIAIALACGQGSGGSKDVIPPDGGTDSGVDAGSDAGADAGPDAGVDAGADGGTDAGADAGADGGTDGGVDAGPWHPGAVITAPNGDGWRFASDGLPSGSVMGASADESGNIWVAGRTAGVFVQRGGSGRFQQFTIADGLHPYGYLPNGSPADPSPDLGATPVLSVSGGPGSSAFVGYGGKQGCEDEWDSHGDHHELADPSIYKSGDADKLELTGGGIRVAHYDIFSGPGVVTGELAGREKLCSVFRIVWQRGTRYVWFGASHGFALGFADFGGNPSCNGQLGCAGVWEHWHPGVNDTHTWLISDLYYGVAVDTWPHADKAGNTFFDVWFGGFARTTRFRFGETLGDYWTAGPLTELYVSEGHNPANIADDPAAQAAYWNRMDIWPDPVGERRDPAHNDWLSSDPDFTNKSQWVFDNVSGIAVLQNGDAWIGSYTNGLRIVDHDGRFRADATSVLPSRQVGAVAKDPTDESIWIGYRDGSGVTRIKQDGTVMLYGNAALGAQAGSEVWDIQVQPATGAPGSRRRILVAFRRGAVGIYDGE